METNKIKTDITDRVRLQVEMTKERINSIDKLAEITGMASRKEVLDNALTILAWAVREVSSGKIIASMNLKDSTFRELAMPCLDTVIENVPKNETTAVLST